MCRRLRYCHNYDHMGRIFQFPPGLASDGVARNGPNACFGVAESTDNGPFARNVGEGRTVYTVRLRSHEQSRWDVPGVRRKMQFRKNIGFYHVAVHREDGWYIGRVLERAGVTTQGRSLDELVEMLRDAIQLMWSEMDVQLELVLAPEPVRRKRIPTTRKRASA